MSSSTNALATTTVGPAEDATSVVPLRITSPQESLDASLAKEPSEEVDRLRNRLLRLIVEEHRKRDVIQQRGLSVVSED